jgi:hypothetical protein
VRVSVEADVPGVAPEAARSWWLDVREGHTDHDFVPGATRRVVYADERSFEVEDRVRWLGLPLFRERSRARARGNTVQLVGENTFARFEATYRFEHAFAPEGTRLVLDATVDLKGPLAWGEGLARPVVERILRWDTEGHAEQLEAALGNVPEAGPMVTRPPTG